MDNPKITAPEPVRVRFAPSPTGYLHIGSARTALFNWLFAKKTKGKFILRIEDTDIKRHIENAIQLIINSLKWLGINWDEGPDIGGNYGPYRQSQRIEIYKEYAEKLIAQKKAYYCFCNQKKSEEKFNSKINIINDNYNNSSNIANITYENDITKINKIKNVGNCECIKLTKEQIKENKKKNLPYAIRFLTPKNYLISFNDLVYGKIKVNSDVLEDFIIIRSNGLPTYNFSVVLDDILMEITHVIRGEDHISNTPKQILIYNSFKKNLPKFAHLPMIIGEDGEKLSKRHGSISIEAYKEEGFLPEAINNYMALLGWSYDEKTTIFSTNDLINKFTLEKINKKPAKFDYNKLLWFNGHYIRNSKPKVLEKLIHDKFLSKIKDKENFIKKLPQLIPLIKPRIKTINEAEKFILPFFNDIDYTRIKNEFDTLDIKLYLNIIREAVLNIQSIKKEDFNPQNTEKYLRELSAKNNIHIKKIAETLRFAIWGSKVSPPLFETIALLGKDKTLDRLTKFEEFLKNIV